MFYWSNYSVFDCIGDSGVTQCSHSQQSCRCDVATARNASFVRLRLRTHRRGAPVRRLQLQRHPSCALLQLKRSSFVIRLHTRHSSVRTVPGAGGRTAQVRVIGQGHAPPFYCSTSETFRVVCNFFLPFVGRRRASRPLICFATCRVASCINFNACCFQCLHAASHIRFGAFRLPIQSVLFLWQSVSQRDDASTVCFIARST